MYCEKNDNNMSPQVVSVWHYGEEISYKKKNNRYETKVMLCIFYLNEDHAN